MSDDSFEYFVSYNQKLSDDIAQRIYDTFVTQRGYKVYVNHIEQRKRTSRYKEKIDKIIRNSKVFILVNSYGALTRSEVIREVKVGFPNGKIVRELWIVRENRDDVPRKSDHFRNQTSIDISEFEQKDFDSLGDLARIIVRLCDGRKNQIQPKETTIPFAPVFRLAWKAVPSKTKDINLEDLREKAKEFFQTKKYESAIEIYEKILDREPLDILSLDAIGTALAYLKKYAEGETYFSLAISLNPRIPEIWNNKSLSLYPQRKFDQALTCINTALKMSPNNLDFINNKALIYFEKGDYDNSLKYYNETLSKDSKNYVALNGKASVLNKKNAKDESFKILQYLYSVDSHNDVILYNLGVSVFEKGELLKALEYFKRSSELNPKNFYSLMYQAIVLRRLSRYEESLKIYDKTIELEPKNYILYYNKGVALGFMGKPKESERLFKKALDLNPNYVDALINRSEAFRQMRRYKKALIEIEKALVLEEDNVRGLGIKGRILMEKNSYSDAETVFKRALKISKRQDLLILFIAVIRMQGRNKEAITICNKELKSDPKNVNILLERGVAYVGSGNIKLAERDFDKVLNINPDEPYANYNKAGILVKSSRFSDSLPFMKKALKLDELVDTVRKDPTFKELRNDKRFATIIPNLE